MAEPTAADSERQDVATLQEAVPTETQAAELSEDNNPANPNGTGAEEQPLHEYSYTERDLFTSEIFKIEIGNIPFHMAPSDFKKLLGKRLQLEPHKIKMFNIGRARFAFVTFKNEQLRDAAIKALDGYKYKQAVLRAGLAKPRADPVQQAKKRKAAEGDDAKDDNGEPASKRSILNIVTPWHEKPYDEQLQEKQDSMEKLLTKLGVDLGRQQNREFNETVRLAKKVANDGAGRKTICNICQICRSPRVEHYRNKNEFTPGRDEQGNVVVGFRMSSYKKGSITVGSASDDMKHVTPHAIRVTKLFEAYLQQVADTRPPYSAESEQGYWRQLTVRTSEKGQCMMLVLMHPQQLAPNELQDEMQKLRQLYDEKLRDANVSSLYFQLFDKKGNDHPIDHLAGAPVIEEELLGLTFEISPPSFFQINTKGAEVLYQRVADLAELRPTTTVLDLFCGTGSIGLSMASRVKRIVGAEIVAEAVENARKVAARHDITNAEFIAGKAEDVISLALSKVSGEDDIVAIVDPPRQGVHNRVIKLLRGHAAVSRIVYVACNPAAAMANILDFCRQPSNNYRGDPFVPVDAQPVDMFPHTPHTELIVSLKRLGIVRAEAEQMQQAQQKQQNSEQQPPLVINDAGVEASAAPTQNSPQDSEVQPSEGQAVVS